MKKNNGVEKADKASVVNSMYMTIVKYPFTTTFMDYPDNESEAIIIYFYGCEHRCSKCHNLLLQQYVSVPDESQALVNLESFNDLLTWKCERHNTRKVVFSGGDPLHPNNREFVSEYMRKYGDKFDICIYTGYDIDEIKTMNICNFKFIKSGKFDSGMKIEPFKDDDCIQLASLNQKMYGYDFSLLSHDGRLYFN